MSDGMKRSKAGSWETKEEVMPEMLSLAGGS